MYISHTKKVILAIIALFFGFNIILANDGGSSGYNPVVVSDSFNFTAKLNNGVVYLSWKPYANSHPDGFVYYKVVRSSTNSNPTYPEDGYIKYTEDKSFSYYEDSGPKNGNNYYRICAIYTKDRICSKVVNLYYEKDSEEVKEDSAKATNGAYGEPVIVDDFVFTIYQQDNKIVAKWAAYAADHSDGFQYYKLIRSNTNSNPFYPEDGYIKASSDKNYTYYEDYSAKEGGNYYRICAIYTNSRVCSEAEKINFEKKYSTDIYKSSETVKPVSTVYYKLTDEIQKKLDLMMDKFEQKMEDDFDTDSQRLAHVEKIKEKFLDLKIAQPKFYYIIKYLVAKLDALEAKYGSSDLSDIEDILGL